jgi:iron complex transport system ATP-binding protein
LHRFGLAANRHLAQIGEPEDEPTAYLDLPRRVEIMRILRHLARTTGSAVLLSTHDLDLALRSADRIWLMRACGVVEVGAPEDLVLSGAFEATFHSEGIEFDRETGSFKIHADQVCEIDVQGEGTALLWTKRALEREGFCVRENGSRCPVCVQVVSCDGSTTWRTTVRGDVREHSTLYEVVSFLRHSDLSDHRNPQ